MKQVITDIVKFAFDCIFSFWTFLIIMFVIAVFAISESGLKEQKIKEQTRILTEACYTQGMVLVQSDAGPRCVSPQSLVKVK